MPFAAAEGPPAAALDTPEIPPSPPGFEEALDLDALAADDAPDEEEDEAPEDAEPAAEDEEDEAGPHETPGPPPPARKAVSRRPPAARGRAQPAAFRKPATRAK